MTTELTCSCGRVLSTELFVSPLFFGTTAYCDECDSTVTVRQSRSEPLNSQMKELLAAIELEYSNKEK